MNINDELQKLQRLHESGAINDDEYTLAKAKVLKQSASDDAQVSAADPLKADSAALELQTRQWAMFLHLSQLATFVVPMAGLIAPIVIWQIKKNELPGLDVHGKIVVNWIISAIIYAVVSALLSFFLIGIPLLIGLGIVGILFPILGGIKANNGEVWHYPLTITFVK